MDDFCIVDIPLTEAVRQLEEMGYIYLLTPVSCRRTADFLADVQGSGEETSVAAFPTGEDTAAIWAWEEGGCCVSDPPMLGLSKTEPEFGLGNLGYGEVCMPDFGPASHFIACTVYAVAGEERTPVITVFDPIPRVGADVLGEDSWTFGEELEFTEAIHTIAAGWVDGDYAVVWCPDTDGPVEELVRKPPRDRTPPGQ